MPTQTIRRQEFSEARADEARDILEHARYGHLATVDDAGLPSIRPLNYALVGDTLYFHCAEGGTLDAHAATARQAVFSVEDTIDWLPSTWRHPDMACPATTYYRAVQVRGALAVVESLDEKANALQAFMQRYQPEGGHSPIRADDPRYGGPLAALTVLRLPFANFTCKIKMGQHLTPNVRRKMYDCLIERARPEDLACARAMRHANEDLSDAIGEWSASDPDGLTWTDEPGRVPLDDLHAMVSATYWAAGRPRHVVAGHLREATVIVAALDESGRLAAYARVCVVDSRFAWIFDVLVTPERRGQGLGSRLMQRVLAHPGLRNATRFLLDTRDAMPFYERFGFQSLSTRERPFGTSTFMQLYR